MFHEGCRACLGLTDEIKYDQVFMSVTFNVFSEIFCHMLGLWLAKRSDGMNTLKHGKSHIHAAVSAAEPHAQMSDKSCTQHVH
jgi:hypothetical protein